MSSKIIVQSRRTLTGLLSSLMLTMLGTGVSCAADSPDHERARQAVEAGDVLPLRTILDRVERDYPGQVMEVELEREKGEWVYEVKLLRKGGALIKLKILARDGAILGFKEKNDKLHRQGESR
ncbi:PepSY domain-containing protein [Accumulibacter sp.]|uniref:PepSY domain-containing protein n=1 Tax=Accumulibacter sp. TaxID=2053492 RepID=UPI0038FC08FD